MARLELAVLCQQAEQEFEKIVLGLPRSLSGGEGPMAQEVNEFAQQLEQQTDLPVVLVDERMTSSEAHATFAQSGKKLKGNKETIDKIAAVIILQHYLEGQGGGNLDV